MKFSVKFVAVTVIAAVALVGRGEDKWNPAKIHNDCW